ncbi:MAG: SDR family oxidoreductase [Schleiferiaceae bacterium]|jgi:NAD(P)-dependent dehydrogenase (short-subunit alcohol dehydrogenase family)|nr:SDR family oxidoreductase [Schleiferiaceae bacterium]
MKRYLVVGGATGTGKAIVDGLIKEGNIVYATYNSTKIDQTHPNLQVFKHDVMTDEIDRQRLPVTLDGLVYCPGSIVLKPFRTFSSKQFEEDFRLQVSGAINAIQSCLPLLKKVEQSSIVLFSTVAVQMGYAFHSLVSSSKGALEGLTRSLAAEFAPNIRVNAIAPSLTNTPLAQKLLSTEERINANAERHPLKRIGTTKDLAAAACYLLNERSSWVTGQIMHVDGGMSSIKI